MSDEVDTSGFVAMCRSLAGIAMTDYERPLLLEVGHVLRNCISHTAVSSKAAIELGVKKKLGYVVFSDGTVIAQWRKADNAEMFLSPSTYPQMAKRWPKGSRIPTIKGGQSWHQMNDPLRRWSDARWAQFQANDGRLEEQAEANHQANIKAALAARGLAKKSWVQIAQSLGIETEVGAAGYILTAKPSNGKTYQNGTSTTERGQNALAIEISNDSNLLTHFNSPDGWTILQASMDARVSYFNRNMELAVFNDIEARASRYPGIFVN